MNENEFGRPTPEEGEPAREQTMSRLGEISRSLGFSSTPEMDSLVEVLMSEEGHWPHLIQWRGLAEHQAERAAGDDWHRAQVALLLEQAKLTYEYDHFTQRLRDDLDDAITYASQMGFEDVAREIQEVIDSL